MPILLLIATLLLGAPAAAHQPSDAYLTLQVDASGAGRIEGRWDIALRDLDHALGLDRDQDGKLTWAEVRRREAAIAAYALARLALASDRGACPTTSISLALDHHGQSAYAVLGFSAACPGPPHALDLRYDLLFDLDPSHRGLLNLAWAGTSTAVLGPETGTLHLGPAGTSPGSILASYLGEGFRHILIGYDHILFLLALLLSVMLRLTCQRCPALMELAALVSAFTLGHAITLALAALDVVDPPARLIESLIAASVVFAALNNVVPLVQRRLWLIALGFGLIHGFGFAGVLHELGLPDRGLLTALLGFNLGVELGQLAILALLVPLLWAFARLDLYPRAVMRAGSAAIAAMALLWLVERALDLPLSGAL